MTIGDWFAQAFEKFGEISLPQAIIFGTLLVLGIGLLLISRNKVKWSTKMTTYAALSIALAFVLSMIRLFRMPQGGSVTPGKMLPLMLFAYGFGAIPGLTASVAFGILDFLKSSAPITNIWSFTLDYLVGFGVIGLTGLFRGYKNQDLGLALGIALASVARFTASLLSGVMFYAEYAEGTGMSPLIYSISYNGTYMLPEMLICLVLGAIVGKRVLKVMR